MEQNIYEEFPLIFDGAEFLFFIDGGFYRGEGYFSDAHSHSFCELLYVAEESLIITLSGEEHLIKKGELFALPHGIEHTVCAPIGASFSVLSFWDKTNVISKPYHITSFPVGNAFLRLLDYYYGKSHHRYELIQACLVEITVHLLDALQKSESSKAHHAQPQNTRLYAIEYYMHTNYKSTPSLTELSKILHLSVSQTDRTVRKLYGASFSERIRTLRIEEAKKLLMHTNMQIYQIAATVGYATTSNFHIAFKQLLGISPSEFRKAKQQR